MTISRFFSALLSCLAFALPATAQDAVGTPLRGDLLTGWQQSDGRRVAAIRLRMAPGWKTYWRSPGDAGIPPEFDWSGSDNLRDVQITWPAPKVFDQGGVNSIGYAREVILPLTITPRSPGAPVTLDTSIDLGVCSDICLPQTIHLRALLDTRDSKPTPAIAAAFAARPYSGAEAGLKSAHCSLRPTARGLEIETRLALPSAGGKETVVIEPGNPNMWMSETVSQRSGNMLVASGEMIAENGTALALDRSAIRITVIGKNHAVEVTGCTSS
ncbi:protein-disulfide reductase DsbD domain-containing protein [Sulfitobacter sp. 1A13191]|jgi:DsbC/DsbD-like thiol-disulfide interchange protein|uniref:protein-disulfide reductase DsbD domain-containing protein n=1 Tax=unclassified Sulfitobacter TaxID=196795 RepID=UPI0037476D10